MRMQECQNDGLYPKVTLYRSDLGDPSYKSGVVLEHVLGQAL